MAKQRKRAEISTALPPQWGGDEGPKEGDTLEGIYTGSKKIRYRNSAFFIHMIQSDETGEVNSFSGAIADRKLSRVPKGTYVWVTYLGALETANGNAKDYKVEYEEGTKLLPENESDIPT